MARSFQSSTIVTGSMILATVCGIFSATASLAGPPKAAKPSYSKPAYSKPSYNKPSAKPFIKPSYKSSGKPFVKSPKNIQVAHHHFHGHLHLVPVVYPVAVAGSLHTLYFIADDGTTQVYGQYEVTVDAYGNTNWGGLVEAQTILTNAGYQCWIDDVQPNTDG